MPALDPHPRPLLRSLRASVEDFEEEEDWVLVGEAAEVVVGTGLYEFLLELVKVLCEDCVFLICWPACQRVVVEDGLRRQVKGEVCERSSTSVARRSSILLLIISKETIGRVGRSGLTL